MMSYTYAYGRSYDEWVEEKARRVQRALSYAFQRGVDLDLSMLAYEVYRERLAGVGMFRWRPVGGRFLDFKPSPFIKNFIGYLVSRLVEGGFISYGWVVEARDRARVGDVCAPSSRDVVRVYRPGLFSRVVEVSDGLRASDFKVEGFPTLLKVHLFRTKLGTGLALVEARDVVYAVEGAVEACVSPKPPVSWYGRRVLRVPDIDTLKDICRWRDPM